MNSPAPMPTPFQVSLERYQNALNYLDTSHKKSLKKEQALEILTLIPHPKCHNVSKEEGA